MFQRLGSTADECLQDAAAVATAAPGPVPVPLLVPHRRGVAPHRGVAPAIRTPPATAAVGHPTPWLQDHVDAALPHQHLELQLRTIDFRRHQVQAMDTQAALQCRATMVVGIRKQVLLMDIPERAIMVEAEGEVTPQEPLLLLQWEARW